MWRCDKTGRLCPNRLPAAAVIVTQNEPRQHSGGPLLLPSARLLLPSRQHRKGFAVALPRRSASGHGISCCPAVASPGTRKSRDTRGFWLYKDLSEEYRYGDSNPGFRKDGDPTRSPRGRSSAPHRAHAGRPTAPRTCSRRNRPSESLPVGLEREIKHAAEALGYGGSGSRAPT